MFLTVPTRVHGVHLQYKCSLTAVVSSLQMVTLYLYLFILLINKENGGLFFKQNDCD